MRNISIVSFVLMTIMITGCSHYRFGNPVPKESRAVAVTVFENGTMQPEAEALLTQAVCRELIREGSMKLTDADKAAVIVTGRVIEYSQKPARYSRQDTDIPVEYHVRLGASITVTERQSGKVLLEPLVLTVDTTSLARGDLPTAKRDALHRAVQVLGGRIVQSVIDIW